MNFLSASAAIALLINVAAATGETISPAADTLQNTSGAPQQISDSARNQMFIAKMKTDYYMSTDCNVLPGEIGDSTIGPGRFVAISDVIIRKNATLTISPGTTFFFEPQRRLIVEGTVLAASTSNRKIVLTHAPIYMRYIKIAIADSLWSGIALEPGSSLLLNRVLLNNAVTGVTTTNTVKQVDIACVDMSKNVQVPLFSNGQRVPVENINCVSTADLLRPTSEKTPGTAVSADSSSRVVIPVGPPGPFPKKTAFTIGSGIVTAGGIGAATFGFWQYRKYGDLYEESTDRSKFSPQKIDRYKDKAHQGELIGILGSVAGVLGAAGLVTLNFVF
jgi:hypothetical protein